MIDKYRFAYLTGKKDHHLQEKVLRADKDSELKELINTQCALWKTLGVTEIVVVYADAHKQETLSLGWQTVTTFS